MTVLGGSVLLRERVERAGPALSWVLFFALLLTIGRLTDAVLA